MHLHLELISGLAGDMTVAALLDMGVPIAVVREALEALPLEGWEIATRSVDCGMACTGLKFDVLVDGRPADAPPEGGHSHDHAHDQAHDHTHRHEHGHEHEHTHDHGHSHDHAPAHEHGHDHEHKHDHGHSHDHAPAHDHGHGHDHGHSHHHSGGHDGSWRGIRAMLNAAPLRDGVRRRAVDIFARIAAAEARVHGMAVDDVVFHEVGALDSVVDIVAAAACVDHLNPSRITFSEVPLGRGFTRSQHGRIPVPAPATLLILAGAEVRGTELAYELVTPTGAGIIAALADGFGPIPAGKLVAVGHGAGTRRLPDRPNMVRAMSFESSPARDQTSATGWVTSSDVVIEANMDDATGELCGWLAERLFEAGALDVWWTPIQMKKGRPAWTLSALCEPGARDTLMTVIMEEGTSIGVRTTTVHRYKSHRGRAVVHTAWGDVQIKVASVGGRVSNVAPEYESARALASATGQPLKVILQSAMAAGWARYPVGSDWAEDEAEAV